MSRSTLRTTLGTATLALSLLATGGVERSFAQTGDTAARAGSSTQTDTDDDGMDLGWIGLLGLAGLLGLRRREATVTRVDRVDTTASTRPRV
jgi:MYXO-CTERM domain-containing protein